MTDAQGEQRPERGRTDAPDAEAVVGRIRERAAAVREREVRRALDRLEAAGAPTEHHCETVRALGDALTASLVAPAVEGVREADEETLRTAVELFEE